MTTRLIIQNGATSNGDLIVDSVCAGSLDHTVLHPGQNTERWVTEYHTVIVRETWPSPHKPSDIQQANERAVEMIANEVALQDKMWGDDNARAKHQDGQLLGAALAQAQAIHSVREYPADPRSLSFEIAHDNYFPKDWDKNAFRDYGSDIANLVVAAAFLHQEIKRRLLVGEDTMRSKREPAQAYQTVRPNPTE